MTYKNLKFQVWDLGGQTSIRPYWRCYYSNTDAVIYVVDSADRDRIGISKQELVSMLEVSYISCQKGIYSDEVSQGFWCVFFMRSSLWANVWKKSWNFVYIQATHRRTPFILTTFFLTKNRDLRWWYFRLILSSHDCKYFHHFIQKFTNSSI